MELVAASVVRLEGFAAMAASGIGLDIAVDVLLTAEQVDSVCYDAANRRC